MIATFLIAVWWPIALALLAAYWIYIGWWWHYFIVMPRRARHSFSHRSTWTGRPTGNPGRLTPREAEHHVAEIMRWLGETSAQATEATNDGGLDVVGRHYAAQVKHYQGSVGRPAVQQLLGASRPDQLTPLFFTSGRYTDAAVEFADRTLVALFVYDAQARDVAPVGTTARTLAQRGLRCTTPPDVRCPCANRPR
ncbi:restriction endonuclease [Oerskovia sp. NPDC060338]|uniref:restriction endonuclease n=1 Tax=Oerskovia sp. NPDC060338 TaxID=3347100 RepID=UPI00364C08D0